MKTTRLNAIKRILKRNASRPALQGWFKSEGFKTITNSYVLYQTDEVIDLPETDFDQENNSVRNLWLKREDTLKMSFNRKYLIDLLQAFDSERVHVEIHATNDKLPLQITTDKVERGLIMPLKI